MLETPFKILSNDATTSTIFHNRHNPAKRWASLDVEWHRKNCHTRNENDWPAGLQHLIQPKYIDILGLGV